LALRHSKLVDFYSANVMSVGIPIEDDKRKQRCKFEPIVPIVGEQISFVSDRSWSCANWKDDEVHIRSLAVKNRPRRQYFKIAKCSGSRGWPRPLTPGRALVNRAALSRPFGFDPFCNPIGASSCLFDQEAGSLACQQFRPVSPCLMKRLRMTTTVCCSRELWINSMVARRIIER